MAAPVCDDLPNPTLSPRVDALPGTPPLFDFGIYLVAAQPGHEAQLPRAAGVYRTIPSLGADGVQPHTAWEHSQG